MFAATIYRKDGEIEAATEYIFATQQEAENALRRYISDHPQADEEVE